MITEDYVSFEISKLLKEKGFDERCWDAYTGSNWTYVSPFKNSEFNLDSEKTFFTIPTLQMAMKWVRNVHNLCIEPYRTACGYLYTISTIPYGSCKCNPREGGDDEDSGQWTTYEGACEAAVKYCLENLI